MIQIILSKNLVLLNEEEKKQLINVYSEIYSCKSKQFVSKKYTIKSIDTVKSVLNRKYNMIFDRGYGNYKIINYVDKN